MDVTSDTVAASNLLSGYTAHDKSGSLIIGTASAGGASPTLQTKSATPTESAQTITADSGYDGLSSVEIGAISGTYVGSQVPTQAAQTIHPSASAQTIASGKYLTGDQTIEAVTTTNLTAANIKSGVVVKVGSATDDDSVLSLTGTAETGGATLEDVANATGTTAVITGTEGGGSEDAVAILNGTIKSYTNHSLTKLRPYAFYNCTSLTTLQVHGVVTADSYCIANTKITALALPKLNTTSNMWHTFRQCSTLQAIDFNYGNLYDNTFAGDSNLTTIVMRSTTLVPLGRVNAFTSTPFASGGTGGTIYVPSALIDSYKAATNWSALDGYGTVTWTAIEGSQYENYYADGTAIS